MGVDEVIIEETDPRGYKITCTREQWVFHIVSNHPFMDTEEWMDLTRKTIRKPDFGIYQDTTFPDRENCYSLLARKGRRYMKVVIEVDKLNKTGRVKTAYTTDSMKAGEKLIWPNSDD